MSCHPYEVQNADNYSPKLGISISKVGMRHVMIPFQHLAANSGIDISVSRKVRITEKMSATLVVDHPRFSTE